MGGDGTGAVVGADRRRVSEDGTADSGVVADGYACWAGDGRWLGVDDVYRIDTCDGVVEMRRSNGDGLCSVADRVRDSAHWEGGACLGCRNIYGDWNGNLCLIVGLNRDRERCRDVRVMSFHGSRSDTAFFGNSVFVNGEAQCLKVSDLYGLLSIQICHRCSRDCDSLGAIQNRVINGTDHKRGAGLSGGDANVGRNGRLRRISGI